MSVRIHSKEVFTDAVRKTRKTDEGYLVGEVNATACGVFAYPGRGPNGTTMRLLRHPSNVFAEASIASAFLKPVIVWHPPENNGNDGLLNVDTIGNLQVGTTGERYEIDGKNLVISFTITKREGIDAVENGLNAVSMGRTAEIIEESGTYNGEPFTHREINCVYDHMAIVDAGRMGPQAKIYLDRLESEQGAHSMKKIFIDNIEYEVPPQVAVEMEKKDRALVSQATESKKLLDAAVAAKDTAEGQVAAKDTEILGLKDQLKLLPKKLRDEAASRSKIESKAKSLGMNDSEITSMCDASDTELMKKAILKKNPDANFTDRSDDYVRGMFDNLEVDEEEEIDDEEDPQGDKKKLKDREDGYVDPIRAAELLAEKDQNAWRTPKA